MSFNLKIQDPASDSATLLEVLLECAGDAERGACVFSFASRAGVDLLLNDSSFDHLLNNGQFDLVVGVDAVTTPAALTLIQQIADRHSNFHAKVFYHSGGSGLLFHPKFSWFEKGNQVRAVIGSGNLTKGGLLKNWEAFGDVCLRGRDKNGFQQSWSNWKTVNDGLLRSPDDQDVIARALRNERERRPRHEEEVVESTLTDVGPSTLGTPMLLAEIPRASSRWQQANFDIENYRTFFQLTPGLTQRVVLYPVMADGTIGDPEIHPGVSVRSRNYRVELAQAAGLSYPNQGRPVGVFLRLGTRRFRYRLLMPGSADYSAVTTVMDDRWSGRRDRMMRVRMDLSEFERVLPNVSI